MISKLEPQMLEAREGATQLYIRKLGDSQVARLGRYFVRDIYFGELLKNENFRCDVFLVEGVVAGFIAYTFDSRDIFSYMLKNTGLFIASLIKGFFRHPVRVTGAVMQNVAFMVLKDKEICPEVRSESLSMVVDGGYKLKSGERIANLLYNNMFKTLYDNKVRQVKSMVKADNIFSRALNNYFKMKTVYKGRIFSRSMMHDTIVYVGDTSVGKDIL